ncbi:LOB domain-containing protein 19 [Sesamum angolense]|uniref:LOB domain-containing protein 19 n=1 Tax=Sesamum angolense TaxID=2727404 RepID=A0AAE2C6Y4_9LAMI|nr:LOB domain-containing protein 19 [Sesamum angolense]
MSNGGGGAAGPCGACKFLRRKCIRGCIFAPYFDSDQGTAHFAAVHRVFGASNASKLLLRIPPHRRLDAVITLCYEALARVRDPVYGCVAHIFTLQQQVVNLQAELAIIQARISTLQRSPLPPAQHPCLSSSNIGASSELAGNSSCLQTGIFDPSQSEETSPEMVSFCNSVDQEVEDIGDLQSLAREYVSRYFPGVRFRPPTSQ